MRLFRHLLLALFIWQVCLPAEAVTVDPTGVNVRHSGSSTAFLTFRSLSSQVPAEGLWCGEINPDSSCVAGTIFGRLPNRSNLSTLSGSSNFTDIMTIPPSVARRAYQAAQSGAASQFFYVRRFVSTIAGPDEFVAVTCRMAGGGARAPLSLTNVVVQFETDKEVLSVSRGQTLPKYKAVINYNGTGRLKGRWELVQPGEPEPTLRDLLTEATLPLEERGLQRRYTEIGRFDIYLPPTGKVVLPGANTKNLPSSADGQHRILLRIEATDEKESRSNILPANVKTGGVAGFPMPILRYYVGRASAKIPNTLPRVPKGLSLLLPKPGDQYGLADLVRFHWTEARNTKVYMLEVANGEGLIFSAAVDPGNTDYLAPSWLNLNEGNLRWRVLAYSGKGVPVAQSKWQEFKILRE